MLGKSVFTFGAKASILFGLISFLALSGCGGASQPTAEVSGKVSVAGKPLTIGFVSLIAEDGRADRVPVKDGTYSTKNAPTGKIKAGVDAGATVTIADNPHFKKMGGMMNKAKEMGYKVDTSSSKDANSPKILPKYSNPEQSGFEFELKPGEKKTFDIVIP